MTFLNINRFHVFCFCLWQLGLVFCGQQLFPIFYNLTPHRDCADSGFSWPKEQCDLSEDQQCDILKNCSHIVVDKPAFHSMVEDFSLYCNKAYDATWGSTIQFLGVLFGTIIYGHLGDHFGRKPVSFCGIAIGIAFGVASGFAPSWEVFAALRFVVGSSIASILIVFYTYIIELILPEQRMFLRAFFNWGYARVIVTLVCFICGYWRSAAMATVMVTLPVLPAILFFLPETPKWYQTKGRFEEAAEAERRILKLSGLSSDNVKVEKGENNEKDGHIYTIKDLFSQREIAKRTVVLGSLWFATSLSAFCSDLNSGNLAGSFYVTQFVSGLVTAFMKIFAFLLDTYYPSFDRRRLHQIPQLLMLICYAAIMLLLIFAPESNCDGDSWRDWTVILINIIGVSLIELTWDACYLVAAECFPTQMRAIGVGTCSLLARIGALVAPQMAYLSNITPAAPYVVILLIGTISLLISIFFLPNTKGVDLANIGCETAKNDAGESKSVA